MAEHNWIKWGTSFCQYAGSITYTSATMPLNVKVLKKLYDHWKNSFGVCAYRSQWTLSLGAGCSQYSLISLIHVPEDLLFTVSDLPTNILLVLPIPIYNTTCTNKSVRKSIAGGRGVRAKYEGSRAYKSTKPSTDPQGGHAIWHSGALVR